MREKIKNEENIESFIDWLRYFFGVGVKQKIKIIKKVSKKNKDFGKWLTSVMDFNFDEQDRLIEELRYSNWGDL